MLMYKDLCSAVTDAYDPSNLDETMALAIECSADAFADIDWKVIFVKPWLNPLEVLTHGYSTPKRHHHTLAHPAAMLRIFKATDLFIDPLIVWATWFHDIVFDDEEASAFVFDRWAQSVNLRGVGEIVKNVITNSKTYDPNGVGIAWIARHVNAIVHDLDYAIFGADPEIYQLYSANIEAEYLVKYTEEQFVAGRLHFLEGLDTENLFMTHFFESLREPAKLNVANEMEIRRYGV